MLFDMSFHIEDNSVAKIRVLTKNDCSRCEHETDTLLLENLPRAGAPYVFKFYSRAWDLRFLQRDGRVVAEKAENKFWVEQGWSELLIYTVERPAVQIGASADAFAEASPGFILEWERFRYVSLNSKQNVIEFICIKLCWW